MLRARIDGIDVHAPDGATILDAARLAGADVPTLCHDDRLAPTGACRLCVVQIDGAARPVASCSTPLAEGMEVTSVSAELESLRTDLLTLLAADYPAEAVAAHPEKPFHQLLRRYAVEATGAPEPSLQDASHPLISVDMSQCITCFRCVRICEEVQGQFVWQAVGRGDRTRIIPASGTPFGESPCVSCGACVDTCPTGALEDRGVLANGVPTRWTRTTCLYCGTGCEMNVGTRDGEIVQVLPVHGAPVNNGHLCVKGRYGFGFERAPDRVTEPMLRDRGGEWRTASWDEAIAHVVEHFTRALAEHGPSSVAVLGSSRATNEENYLAQKFARVVLGTNNVDCCARVCHAPSAAAMKGMFGAGAATSSFDDIERARTILICGANPTDNHPVVGARLRQAALRGASLIVLDPRRTELAAIADVHLALRPGTNIPVLLAMAHVIIADGLADESFIAARVDGFDAFRDHVSAWTPERAAALAGIDPENIRAAARLYGNGAPAIAFHGLGVTEHVQGTDGVSALANLALLTGNVGKPGTGVNPLRGQNNVQGSAHMGCTPTDLTGGQPLAVARERFENVWGHPIPAEPGYRLPDMLDAAAGGRLKALWAIGYDFLASTPSVDTNQAALEKLDCVIIQDLFLTDTAAAVGTVFLPVASGFEKDGTFMNSDRRIQRIRAAIPPPGNPRPDWQIVCDVARAMGHEAAFDFASPADVWEEVRQVWPAGAGISYARLDDAGIPWPCPAEDHPGTPSLHTEKFISGPRTELRAISFDPTPEVTDADYPLLLNTGRVLAGFNVGTMTLRTPLRRIRSADTLDISPQDATRYELREGDIVEVESRHGSARLPVRVDSRVTPGQLFTTFHEAPLAVNRILSPNADRVTGTPEYKVTAVRLKK